MTRLADTAAQRIVQRYALALRKELGPNLTPVVRTVAEIIDQELVELANVVERALAEAFGSSGVLKPATADALQRAALRLETKP